MSNIKTVMIERYETKDNYALGNCYVIDEDNCTHYIGVSLERGWKNNQKNISCVPTGEYPLVLEYSPKFKQDLWELKKVPKRAECKFHAANYWYELNGCIALGEKVEDINKDGYPDITKSKKTMREFHKALKRDKEAKLIIKDRVKSY